MEIDVYTNHNESCKLLAMNTTCPLCKKPVVFAIIEDEFIAQQRDHYREENAQLKYEIQKLNAIIDRILHGSTKNYFDNMPDSANKS